MEKERILVIAGVAFVALTAFFCWCYTKKSPRVEKWGWRVIGLLAAGFAVFTVWYHVPIVCCQTVRVCTYEEQDRPVEVEIDVEVHRNYLYGTSVRGTIKTPYGTYSNDDRNDRSSSPYRMPWERTLHASFYDTGNTNPYKALDSFLLVDFTFRWNWRELVFVNIRNLLPNSDDSVWYRTDWLLRSKPRELDKI